MQHIFPGAKHFEGGLLPPAPFLVTGLHLNDLNMFMQGMYVIIFLAQRRSKSSRRSSRSESVISKEGVWETFQFLMEIWRIRQSAQFFQKILLLIYHTYNHSEKVLPHDLTLPEWIQQPFLAEMSDADNLKEEFIDLQENQVCKTKIRASSLSHFWCDQLVAFPGLERAALEMITPFPTT